MFYLLQKEKEAQSVYRNIQFIEMTNLSTNANQMLEGFFADNTDTQTNITQEILQKEEFDIDKVSDSLKKFYISDL